MSQPVITEIWTGQRYTRDRSGRNPTRVFSVLARSEENALQLLATSGSVTDAIGGPVFRGSIYINHNGDTPDPFVQCHTLDVQTLQPGNSATTGHYKVFAHYGIPDQSREYSPEPTLFQTAWSMEQTTVASPAETDVNGYPVINTAGEPIAGVTYLAISEALVARKLYISTSYLDLYGQLSAYNGKVNSVPYKGAAARCLYCTLNIEDTSQLSPDQSNIYRATFRFAYKPPKTASNVYRRTGTNPTNVSAYAGTVGGWDDLKLNQGYTRIAVDDSQNKTVESNIDSGGLQVIKSLDKDGKPLDADQQPVLLLVQHYEEIDFAGIGL
jgi:hypothetical protein